MSFAAAAKSQGPKEVVAHAHRKQTSGRADPQLANRILSEKLKGSCEKKAGGGVIVSPRENDE